MTLINGKPVLAMPQDKVEENADGMVVYHLPYGWIVQGHCCTGGGTTRNKAIDDWVETVRTTMCPGGFYLRSAKPIARRLKRGG